uniref:small monomeric GTPase n=1 Tax=Oncorhynchus mykiss TaxID=8022 RepID=A0A8C7W1L7_ONCMY
ASVKTWLEQRGWDNAAGTTRLGQRGWDNAAGTTRLGQRGWNTPICCDQGRYEGGDWGLYSGVGKTCLLVRFKDGAFLAGSFISTVGIDFRNKVMNIDRLKVKLQIWDTAGQERFRSVTHAYYRDANALLLLYDVTNRTSFDNIKAWLTEIHDYAQQDVVLMLLGNKADATQQRVVKREDGERLAKEFGVPYMETSAKSGLNVELSFTAVAKELKHRSMKEPNEPKFKLQDYVNKEMKSAGCAC